MSFSIHTSRLLIRPVTIEDAQSMYRYRSDAEVNRFLPKEYHAVEDITDLIRRTASEINVPDTWFQLVLICKENGQLIGDVGLHFLASDGQHKQVEIGYTLAKNYHGKGYATEALRAILDHVFTTLQKHRVIASIDPENEASMRLLERLGFRKEAHFKESLFFRGRWADDVIYALLKLEWRSVEIPPK